MTIATVGSVGSALTGALRTSSAVPVPSGVVANSVVLVHMYVEISSAVTPPAGFTELTFSPAPETSGPSRQRVWWKRATGADSGTYTFTHASSWTSGAAARYAGAVTTGTPVEVLASAQRSTNGTLTPAVSGTTAGGDRLLVYGATARGSSAEWTPPSEFTEIFDPSGDQMMIATKGQPAAGGTGSLVASATISTWQTVTLVAIVPAVVSPDVTAPSVPTGVTAIATGPTTTTVSWSPSTDAFGVTSYTVYRGGVSIATGVTGTSYADSGLLVRTTYSYTVAARDAAGNTSAQSSAASVQTLSPSDPALYVFATAEPNNLPPRVRLDVVDTRPTQASSVTVIRMDPDGGTPPVRTGDGAALPLSVSGTASVALIYDYEMPLGVPVTYATAEAPGSVSSPVTVASDEVWLVHPGLPESSMTVEFRAGSFEEETWDVRQGIFWPMGRENPVVHTDGRRKAPSSSVTVVIDTLADLRNLRSLVNDAGVLLMNVPETLKLGVDSCYIAVGAITNRRLTDIGTDPYRSVTLPYQVVDRPAGGSQAERTYIDVLVDNVSYASLMSKYTSYSALLAGP